MFFLVHISKSYRCLGVVVELKMEHVNNYDVELTKYSNPNTYNKV